MCNYYALIQLYSLWIGLFYAFLLVNVVFTSIFRLFTPLTLTITVGSSVNAIYTLGVVTKLGLLEIYKEM